MNKQIPTTLGILIIVLLAGGVVGATFFLYSEMEEDIVVERPEVDESAIEEEEKTRRNVGNFEDLLKVIDSNCNLELSKEKTLQNGLYDGFNWLKGNEAHLIQGYMFVLESDVRKKKGTELVQADREGKRIIYIENPGFDFYLESWPMDMAKEKSEEKIGYVLSESCGSKILDHLINNFDVNQQNSSGENILGFERNGVKCIYEHFPLYKRNDSGALFCGDIRKSKTPDEYSEIFKATYQGNLPTTTTFRIGRIEGNFAIVGTGHAGVLLKKENNQWKYLQGTQDAWPCEEIFENNVPPNFVNNFCFFRKNEEGKIEFWEYDEEKEEWVLERTEEW